MSKINTGGPAFPFAYKTSDGINETVHINEGMTLRDYAAIHADLDKLEFATLDSILEFVGAAAPEHDITMGEIIELSAKAAAKVRYAYADAMIAEREKVGAS